jgi:hypothetical protein
MEISAGSRNCWATHGGQQIRRGKVAFERLRRSSGRRTWKATVTLPDAGKVEFVFDVIY